MAQPAHKRLVTEATVGQAVANELVVPGAPVAAALQEIVGPQMEAAQEAKAAAEAAATTANNAKTAAEAAKSAAEAVGNSNDTITKGLITNPASQTAEALNATYVPRWKANTAYLAGDKVLNPSGDIVSAKTGFTSGATYSASNWDYSATFSKRDSLPVYAKDYGVKGDGIADDSASMVAALAAASGKALILPPGTIKIDSGTRLQMYASYSTLVGDPSGNSTLKFTHANGGIDVGDGTNFVYQTLIQNVIIDGYNLANNPLRLRKSEEMGMVNSRVHQAVVSCIEMTDTSLFHSNRLQLARAPIGIKTLGYMGTVGLQDANFYILDTVVSVEGSQVTNLVVYGVSFIEQVKVGISFNRPGALISVGNIRFRDCYVTTTLTEFTLFKGVATSGLNAAALEAIEVNAYIPNVTTPPFIDFTAVNNSGSTLRARLSDTTFTATALGSGKLVAVHASQNWFQFFVTLIRLNGVTTAQYTVPPFVTGGVALTPLQLSGSGTPEAVMTAPVGSTYQNYGGGAGTSLYVKQTGTGNTGWVGK